MTRYEQEWHYRKVVMEAILDILRDGNPRTAPQILHSLPYANSLKVNKKLVNSILFSEAKRYVIRDNKSYRFRIREADEVLFVLPPWDLVRTMTRSILEHFGPLTVNEIKEKLEDEGATAPKWMIKAILADDRFLHSA